MNTTCHLVRNTNAFAYSLGGEELSRGKGDAGDFRRFFNGVGDELSHGEGGVEDPFAYRLFNGVGLPLV